MTSPHENPTSGDQRAAKCDYASGREWTRLVVEIVALCGLIYYAHQAKIQADAATDAAGAATKAANAAADSAQVARSTAELELRPWLVRSGMRAESEMFTKPFLMVVGVKNVGKLPAIYVDHQLEWIVSAEFPSDPPYVNVPHALPAIAPGETPSWSVMVPAFDRATVAALMNGQITFFIYGYAQYWDTSNGKGGLIFCDYYNVLKQRFSSCLESTYNLMW